MKKTIIAGAAATVLAAMPVVGVFAATEGAATDVVTLEITSSCSVEASGSGEEISWNMDINGGELGGQSGSKGTDFTVTCNTVEGWTLSANASDLTDSKTNISIPFGKIESTGMTESAWSAKLVLDPTTASTSVAINGGWDDFASEKTVGSGTSGTVAEAKTIESGKAGVSGLKITPYYKGYIVKGQTAGTYEGEVEYTIVSVKDAD